MEQNRNYYNLNSLRKKVATQESYNQTPKRAKKLKVLKAALVVMEAANLKGYSWTLFDSCPSLYINTNLQQHGQFRFSDHASNCSASDIYHGHANLDDYLNYKIEQALQVVNQLPNLEAVQPDSQLTYMKHRDGWMYKSFDNNSQLFQTQEEAIAAKLNNELNWRLPLNLQVNK